MSAYAWRKKQLAFHFCATCACVVAWLSTSRGEDGRLWGAVNLRLAEDPEAVSAVPLRHHVTEIHDDLPLDGMVVGDVWA